MVKGAFTLMLFERQTQQTEQPNVVFALYQPFPYDIVGLVEFHQLRNRYKPQFAFHTLQKQVNRLQGGGPVVLWFFHGARKNAIVHQND